MLMRKSMNEFSSSTRLHINKPYHACEPLFRPNSSTNLAFKNHKNCKQSVQCLNNTRVSKNGKIRRNLVIYSSAEPGPPSPSDPSPNPLSWILAIVLAVVPLIGQKWGPLLKKKVETALNEVEEVVEAVEKVAEEVEKVAEDLINDLPVGGKLRKAVEFVENVAERTAKDADIVDDFIDKVQEEEKEVESYVESLEEKEKEKEKDKEAAQKAKETETKTN
ncbi:uncharacterized protein Fot_19805 [Forsythia ovata]|uniref:Uncharacterized protein n=1 Tax=Forsythia ovata TaxID=205694 RepID=A0ABD1VM33_9LAMI